VWVRIANDIAAIRMKSEEMPVSFMDGPPGLRLTARG
jgi:hypothetical protein